MLDSTIKTSSWSINQYLGHSMTVIPINFHCNFIHLSDKDFICLQNEAIFHFWLSKFDIIYVIYIIFFHGTRMFHPGCTNAQRNSYCNSESFSPCCSAGTCSTVCRRSPRLGLEWYLKSVSSKTQVFIKVGNEVKYLFVKFGSPNWDLDSNIDFSVSPQGLLTAWTLYATNVNCQFLLKLHVSYKDIKR